MTFQPKNFIRLEWDGEELTCYGRRGSGVEEPWNAHEFEKETETRKFFDGLTKLLKQGEVKAFVALMSGKR